MARPWVLVVLLLLIVFTSQFEWKQQLGNETPKDQYALQHQESVKEKIILSQEKNIQKLNELVRSLREQLLRCRGENEVSNGSVIPLAEHFTNLHQPPILDD
ncbi:hypothetical protein SLEP1_g40540 [Rubroshorea leprosula]|uniref:Uncharacterized protein n=1 Tax=Rubroshorea leprosula TaxID=152421 RepID=A0AAV5L3S8_9ROSI|nr:hypothetical protein SLEP1_g40540 [Rubroshorea leprosula]